jgi:BMFP domain-containing protein YqiC
MKKDVMMVNSEDFNPIITKAGDVNALEFKTIKSKELTEINDWMPVVNQKVSAFQKQNSQTTTSLMTLNMLDSAPYRVLRQILAQVQKKRSALKENMYKLEKKKIKYNKLVSKIDVDDLEKLEIKKFACDIIDAQGYIEASLKELGGLKRRYEEICKNKCIPEDWDEADFEEQEIEHHIKSMFRNGLRDRLQGSHNMGTMEYFAQFGINSIYAYHLIDDYVRQVRSAISAGKGIGIESEYEFLDKMYEIFKNNYKKAAARIGLDSVTHADFLMKENK